MTPDSVFDHYGADTLLALAHRHDPALDPEDVAAVGPYLDRLNDARFTRYGLDEPGIAAIRATFAAWPRP